MERLGWFARVLLFRSSPTSFHGFAGYNGAPTNYLMQWLHGR